MNITPTDPARLETLPPTGPSGTSGLTPLGERYLLERPIGEGSTGRVWRGVRRQDSSAVAIKVLREEYRSNPAVVARFVRESTALRQLRHPHLVPVDDMVSEGDSLAVIMELVNGDDLRGIVQRGGLDARRAVAILAQVARALGYIHAAGVLHRDVKPENILVTRRAGQPWALLTDFGLAWVADGRQLTQSTHVLGTVAYVAPEILAGRGYGPAADVYSLGVSAYELLTGRRPFDGEHPLAVMRAHLDDEPRRPTGMAKELWRVVRACLAKRPEDRPTADDVAGKLERLSRRRRVLITPAPRHSRRRPRVMAAGLAASALAISGLAVALTAGWPGRPPQAEQSQQQRPMTQRVESTSQPANVSAAPLPPGSPLRPATGVIITPDGRCLDDDSSRTTNGNPVRSFSCNGTAAQRWSVRSDGTLRVLGRCLRAAGTTDWSVVHIWTCDGSAAQRWVVGAGSSLVSVASGKCLDNVSGTQPVVRTCDGSARQRWKLPK